MPLMRAPETGVKIRMYRQGHGDCFLLAFPRGDGGDRPVYMMIDCGYKPGSQKTLAVEKIGQVVEHIGESTGKFIDVVVITHEHQDHVNGLTHFKDFQFGEAWFAWTEDPKDDLANELRVRHKDQLLGLLGAQEKSAALAMEGRESQLGRLNSLLSLELGGEERSGRTLASFAAAGRDPKRSLNKRAMKLIKDRVRPDPDTGVPLLRFIRPHDEVLTLPDSRAVRAFALGPPRDPDLLDDEDPKGAKAFPGHGLAGGASFFAAAAISDEDALPPGLPFPRRESIPWNEAFDRQLFNGFFLARYGVGDVDDEGDEPPDDASFRRIDGDWLDAAEQFALKLNKGINNTSLVLAFELPKSKKVLLFAGDAQLGNWASWTAGEWEVDGVAQTARDLLERTVLYKVGHHGSHNATLNGTLQDDHANLSWMGQGRYGDELTAMITAVREWALDQDPVWDHPLPSIKTALLDKCSGRVLQTDTDEPTPPGSASDPRWRAFTRRLETDPLYFDLTVADD